MNVRSRRQFLRAQVLRGSGAAALFSSLGLRAEALGIASAPAPLDNVRIVTGFTPGGGTSDTLCRRVVEGLAVMGLESKSSTPQELTEIVKESYELWGPIVRRIGFTADS